MNLLNYDNPVLQKINRMVDAVWLNLLFLIFSLPLITAGASMTAFYATYEKVFVKEKGKIWGCFWNSFSQNFRQATVVWLIELLLLIIIGADGWIMYQFIKNGVFLGNFYILFMVFGVLLVIWGCYLFPYVSHFADSTRKVFENTARLAMAYIFSSILLLIILLAVLAAIYVMPMSIFFAPVIGVMGFYKVLEPIFDRYS